MKLKFRLKGSPFVPLLIVFFLLIISAVASYVVINQGTGGYKARAGGTCQNETCWADTRGYCRDGNTSHCTTVMVTGATGSSPAVYQCQAKNEFRVDGSKHYAYFNCGEGARCSNSASCVTSWLECRNNTCQNKNAPTPTKTPTPTPKPSACSTITNTCGYVNKAGCPDGVVYCSSGYSCDSDNNASNGIQGPAEGKTGKCVVKTTATTDPKPPADNNPPSGGTASCGGGTKCDGTPVTGAHGETVCGLNNVAYTCSNGSWTGPFGACSCPSAPPSAEPPTATPTVPPATTGNATLAFTLKFQGVTGNPRGGKTVPFKVKLKGSTVTDYVKGTLTADSSGKWTGSVPFSGIALGPDTKYTVFVKVGKHLQKRICGFAPTESPAGTYNCSDSNIPLTAGVNNLDFSGILQLVGDLPSASGDQNGVVDSYDISYVLNNLGSTEQSKLAIGDLNFDGIIDSQDRSLIIQSLNVKYDDE